ncbi:MAG: hypothetical protein RIC06_17465 [Cyclobacteriaceae bacterium]
MNREPALGREGSIHWRNINDSESTNESKKNLFTSYPGLFISFIFLNHLFLNELLQPVNLIQRETFHEVNVETLIILPFELMERVTGSQMMLSVLPAQKIIWSAMQRKAKFGEMINV